MIRWIAASAAALLSGCAVTGPDLRQPVISVAEMRQRNVVMQQWDTSCGAAALATIFTFHLAEPVSEEQIAKAILAHKGAREVKERGGFSLLDLKRFAESRGYSATGYLDMGIEQLARLTPAIVPMATAYDSHFVVVKGVEGDEVHVADPSFGNLVLSRASFARSWHEGIAFVVASGRNDE